jgi:hypothetical protein
VLGRVGQKGLILKQLFSAEAFELRKSECWVHRVANCTLFFVNVAVFSAFCSGKLGGTLVSNNAPDPNFRGGFVLCLKIYCVIRTTVPYFILVRIPCACFFSLVLLSEYSITFHAVTSFW